MKILWIEDFGAGLDDINLSLEIFEDILPTNSLDEDEPLMPQLKEKIESFSNHEIFLCNSYVSWLKLFLEHEGDFDVVIIDINLSEKERTPVKLLPKFPVRHFDKQAGFYIYNQLIKNGFPDDNIAFFTAQKGSLSGFIEYCGRAFMDIPKNTFEKKVRDFPKVRKWLQRKADSPYIKLRRGIINGCKTLINEIQNTEEELLEDKLIYYKTTTLNVTRYPIVYRTEILDYVNHLKDFFPLKEKNNVRYDLRLFVKNLALKWDRNFWGFSRDKRYPASYTNTEIEDNFYQSSQMIMKLIRNWASHDLLDNDITYKDIAFFFMLCMRSIFQLDFNKTYHYELVLGELFEKKEYKENELQVKQIEQFLFNSFNELHFYKKDIKLNNSIPNQYLSHVDAYGKMADDFETKGDVSEILKGKIQEKSLRLIYNSFWHGLFPAFFEDDNATINFKMDTKADITNDTIVNYYISILRFSIVKN